MAVFCLLTAIFQCKHYNSAIYVNATRLRHAGVFFVSIVSLLLLEIRFGVDHLSPSKSFDGEQDGYDDKDLIDDCRVSAYENIVDDPRRGDTGQPG